MKVFTVCRNANRQTCLGKPFKPSAESQNCQIIIIILSAILVFWMYVHSIELHRHTKVLSN